MLISKSRKKSIFLVCRSFQASNFWTFDLSHSIHHGSCEAQSEMEICCGFDEQTLQATIPHYSQFIQGVWTTNEFEVWC